MKRIIIQKRVIVLLGLLLLLGTGAWLGAEDPFIQIAFGGKTVHEIVVDPLDPGTLYAIVIEHLKPSMKLYKTKDFGFTWQLLSDAISWILVNPKNPSNLLAGMGLSIYQSLDGGQKWHKISDTYVSSCFYDPLNPDVLIGASYQDIRRSEDGGSTWNTVFSTYACQSILTIQPSDSKNIYCIFYSGDPYPWTKSEVVRSIDQGDHWSWLGGLPWELVSPMGVFIDFFPDYVYWGDYVSLDKGSTWIRSYRGLGDNHILSMKADPFRPSSIYAGTIDGLYWKHIQQDSWEYVGLVSQSIVSMAFDIQNSITYLGTCDGLWIRKAPPNDLTKAQVDVSNPAPGDTLLGTVSISGKAKNFSNIDRIEIAIDNEVASTIPGNQETEQGFTWNWVTWLQNMGGHILSVRVVDGMGYDSFIRIPVKVENILCSLKAERIDNRSWLMRRSFVKLTIGVDNRGRVRGVTYSILRRRTEDATWTPVILFTEAQLQSGSFVYFDKTPRTSTSYEYRVEAKANDVLQGASDSVEIR